MRSLRAVAVATCARSRRTSRASRSPSSRARWAWTRRSIVKLASNENPRGIGPRTRAAIEAALGDIARYPDGNGFELKQALAQRYRRRHGARSCSATARTTCSSWWRSPSSGRGAPRLLAALLRGLSARHPGARRALDRGAGEELRPRPRGDGEGDRRRDLRRLDRQPEQSRPAPSRATRRSRRSSSACRSACWWCSTRPTTSTCRAELRGDSVKLAQAPPEPGHHAHLLQGLRPRRAARRLRARASVGRRRDEPRAPAVQRQQPGARRGAPRRSTTWSSSRAATPRTCRACARSRRARARLGLDFIPSHGNFITVRVGKARGDLQAPAAPRRDRAPGGRRLRAAGAPARHRRHCGGERTLPGALARQPRRNDAVKLVASSASA